MLTARVAVVAAGVFVWRVGAWRGLVVAPVAADGADMRHVMWAQFALGCSTTGRRVEVLAGLLLVCMVGGVVGGCEGNCLASGIPEIGDWTAWT